LLFVEKTNFVLKETIFPFSLAICLLGIYFLADFLLGTSFLAT